MAVLPHFMLQKTILSPLKTLQKHFKPSVGDFIELISFFRPKIKIIPFKNPSFY